MMKLVIIIMMLCFPAVYAQEQIRGMNNEGVDHYNTGKYSDAEVNFKKSVEKLPDNFAANFNLGDAYYKQGRYDEAVKAYETAIKNTGSNTESAKSYHNIGNSLLKMQESVQDPARRSEMIKQSIEAYKNSLKLNPGDRETQYNLSYALSLLDKNNNKNQQQNQNQNNEQNKDQQQNQNQQNDQNKDQNQQNQNNNQQQKPEQNQESKQDNLKQPEQNKISKEEAERILQALKNNEKDLQKKLRKIEGIKVKKEKDW